MYAVIASGGKQHKVTLGEIIKLEKLDAQPGAAIEFDEVLLIANGEDVQVGTPYLTEKVSGEVIGQGKHKKVNILKFKRRKQYLKQQGHRQEYTEVKITTIGKEQLKPKAAKPKQATKEEEPTEKEQE